jgi:4-diphosphocytidyl-2-C-methyl-D-erythritol kinase
MIKIAARAKINLFLEVTAKRPDGYHDLATLFARVGVADRLFLRKAAPGIKLVVQGGPREFGRQADNIVHKAAVEFFRVFRIEPAVEIKLEKIIPVGAGLGGGSSDAAAALLGLARLYKLGANTKPRLMKIAAALGSDVPFFMLEAMAAEGRGRGEKLKAIQFKGRLPYVVLVYPGAPVYTKEVYGNLKVGGKADIKARLADFTKLKGLLKKGAFSKENAALLFNRLEEPVLPRHKAVSLAKARLVELGADAVLMSGSGATVFALCWSGDLARRVAASAGRIQGYKVFFTKFC